jgi:hypothetical protein
MRLAMVFAAVCCLAAPLRAEVRWQLDCKAGQVGTVTVNGAEGWGNYAYVTLTVSNHTGRDLPVSLGVWADSDVVNAKPYRGSIDPVVKEKVEAATGKTYKTLTDARGEKLAKDGSIDLIVTFGKIDAMAGTLDVNVLGLVDRVFRDKGKTFVEDKALVLHLVRPGDEYERQKDLLKVESSKWVVLAPAKELVRKA